MTSHSLRNIVLLMSAFLYGAAAHGDTVYNESASPDLSNNGLAPTQLMVSLGLNDLFGTTGKTGTVIDRDYFTFTVPQGLELTAITVLPGTGTLGALDESFIGIESGPQVTVSTAATDATGLLGWDHYGVEDITDGTNILPLMGSSGLGPPVFPERYRRERIRFGCRKQARAQCRMGSSSRLRHPNHPLGRCCSRASRCLWALLPIELRSPVIRPV